jgi:hypothetical protein
MSQSKLTELGIKYGTDKVSRQFTDRYDMIFNPIRKTVFCQLIFLKTSRFLLITLNMLNN